MEFLFVQGSPYRGIQPRVRCGLSKHFEFSLCSLSLSEFGSFLWRQCRLLLGVDHFNALRLGIFLDLEFWVQINFTLAFNKLAHMLLHEIHSQNV